MGSVVDYMICSQNLTSRVLELDIAEAPIEMKLDHMPFYIRLNLIPTNQHDKCDLFREGKQLAMGEYS